MTLLQAEATARKIASRRINEGRTTIKLLAQKSGYSAPHVSNWVRGRRDGSVPQLNAMLCALELEVELLPTRDAVLKRLDVPVPRIVPTMHGVPDAAASLAPLPADVP